MMFEPRERFYKKLDILQELDKKGILEIAYNGNIGFHELVNFYSKATDVQIEHLEYYLRTNQIPKAIDIIEVVTGVRLVLSK